MIYSNLMKLGMAALLALSLVQCQAKTDDKASAPVAPPPPPYAFGVTLTFTPQAVARLKKLHQKVRVSARYYGLPIPATASQVDKFGVIDIKTDTVEVTPTDTPYTVNGHAYTYSAKVNFDGKDVPTEALKSINSGKPLVLVEAVADKKGVLQCDIFQDYVFTAQSRPIVLSCDLAG
ncbi:hypothetical protein [Asticcacaulis sp. EMRT-3]|uniref:hypothetical protein n=1 Tax=Asticcacaulis sp. EMRT-3 TaxID=3040349 RepID=UPI0024AF32BB|nr:hypothetical protein [Asticcacaulis sp. EMRT-3]MDI7775701.1 hypothetical protein [Asticcacaulis sp. EMRT-3]